MQLYKIVIIFNCKDKYRYQRKKKHAGTAKIWKDYKIIYYMR